MNSIKFESVSTKELEEINDRKRKWLASNTTNHFFEQEYQEWESVIRELNKRSSVKIDRLSELHNALADTSGTAYFSIGECICINQERGYLLSIGGLEELRAYKVPENIENKLKQLSNRYERN